MRTFYTVIKGGSLRSPPRRGPKAPGMRPLRVRPGARTATRKSEQIRMTPLRLSSSLPTAQLAATASKPSSQRRYAIGFVERPTVTCSMCGALRSHSAGDMLNGARLI